MSIHFLRIKETCLYSRDLERAEKFYREILGLEKIGGKHGQHVFFRAGDSVLLIFNPDLSSKQEIPPPHDGEGRIHFAFEVEKKDYESAKQELISKDIVITHEHTWSSGDRSFYFNDPDGHLLEIIEGDAIWGIKSIGDSK